ncbi:sensor histidine kinase [Streptomyces sp. S186]|uniref:sensor histidine kinase n=1 Tax=Streptomyces sp. S186 TaxID=3434395 RepID=UPI003F667698
MSVGRVARRWAHLILGGALLMPFFLLASVALPLLVDGADPLRDLGVQLAAFGCALPLAALAGLLFPVLRPLEAAAVRALCAVPVQRLAEGPAVSLAARWRSALWFTAHLLAGGIVSAMTLAVPPAAVLLLLTPFGGDALGLEWPQAFDGWSGPVATVALLALLWGTGCGAGALLSRCAPVLLGPTPADRLAAAECRAAELAARNRLARELHDAVGHALSAVTLQAGAARRVLESDPEFARQALAAIEETTRSAVAELDTVLGLLRTDDEAGTGMPAKPAQAASAPVAAASAPTLDGLEALLHRTRAAGVRVTAELCGDRAGVPPVLSRAAYRIVQEGLSNALRHAGPVPVVNLQLHVKDGELRLTMENPLTAAADGGGAGRAGGGRGLRGIAERARLLGGAASAEAADGVWRLTARLPVAGPAGERAADGGDGGSA